MNQPKPVVLEDVDCPLGCAREDKQILLGRDLLHNIPGKFSVVQCSTCGLMRTNPRPTPETIGNYYPINYGPYLDTHVADTGFTPRSSIKKNLGNIIRRIFNFNTEPLPRVAPGRLLEVGCASGSFLHRMAGQGWQVQGIEYSPMAARAAAALGYQVHVGALESAPQPEALFDLIVGWMVLEHLHEPVEGLKKLKSWAKPGAWLVLSVPNAGSLEFRFFKQNWYALQVPTHLHHFTPKTIERVLDEAGWKLEKVFHQRVLGNLFASTGYMLRHKGYIKIGQKLIDFPSRAGRWNYVMYPLAWLLGLFGQTGRMTVWARINS